MDTTLFLAIVAASASLGAITSGILGWLDSGEAFNGRKFASTIVRAIVAGITLATAFTFDTSVNILLALFVVFLAGMGIDSGGHRLSKAVNAAGKEAPAQPTAPQSTPE